VLKTWEGAYLLHASLVFGWKHVLGASAFKASFGSLVCHVHMYICCLEVRQPCAKLVALACGAQCACSGVCTLWCKQRHAAVVATVSTCLLLCWAMFLGSGQLRPLQPAELF
jgi:hypothetical protein